MAPGRLAALHRASQEPEEGRMGPEAAIANRTTVLAGIGPRFIDRADDNSAYLVGLWADLYGSVSSRADARSML
jgi:hypothetical protein